MKRKDKIIEEIVLLPLSMLGMAGVGIALCGAVMGLIQFCSEVINNPMPIILEVSINVTIGLIVLYSRKIVIWMQPKWPK